MKFLGAQLFPGSQIGTEDHSWPALPQTVLFIREHFRAGQRVDRIYLHLVTTWRSMRSASGSDCQSGVWAAGGISGGSISFLGTYWGSMSRYNGTGTPLFVSAYGGNGSGGTCGNRYQLSASVYSVPLGGWVPVAGSSHTYDVGSKSESIGFMVPAGSTYQISSSPYTCGAGVMYISEYMF